MGVADGVGVKVGVTVGVSVGVGVKVAVSTESGIEVGVTVGVGVKVAVSAESGIEVGVSVGVGVASKMGTGADEVGVKRGWSVSMSTIVTVALNSEFRNAMLGGLGLLRVKKKFSSCSTEFGSSIISITMN